MSFRDGSHLISSDIQLHPWRNIQVAVHLEQGLYLSFAYNVLLVGAATASTSWIGTTLSGHPANMPDSVKAAFI